MTVMFVRDIFSAVQKAISGLGRVIVEVPSSRTIRHIHKDTQGSLPLIE